MEGQRAFKSPHGWTDRHFRLKLISRQGLHHVPPLVGEARPRDYYWQCVRESSTEGKGRRSRSAFRFPMDTELIQKARGSPCCSSGCVSKRFVFEGAAAVCRENGECNTSDPMSVLSWYHPGLTRHAADCMLIDNAPEGSYLLRPSTNHERDNSYVLSVKFYSSVQHIKVTNASRRLTFGNSTFESMQSFRKHFEQERPVIGDDSGITVILRFPYKRFVRESHFYTDVVHHAVTNMLPSASNSENSSVENLADELGESYNPQAVSSKEGFLTKQGWIRKNWKKRWFVLRGSMLSYFRTKQSRYPIDSLNLSKAQGIDYDNSRHKQYCFSIEFKKRTYYLQASCAEDCQLWVEFIRSNLQT